MAKENERLDKARQDVARGEPVAKAVADHRLHETSNIHANIAVLQQDAAPHALARVCQGTAPLLAAMRQDITEDRLIQGLQYAAALVRSGPTADGSPPEEFARCAMQWSSLPADVQDRIVSRLPLRTLAALAAMPMDLGLAAMRQERWQVSGKLPSAIDRQLQRDDALRSFLRQGKASLLRHLTPVQLQAALDCTAQMDEFSHRAAAVQSLAAAAGGLSVQQLDELVNIALRRPCEDETWSIFAALEAAFVHMTASQHNKLIQFAEQSPRQGTKQAIISSLCSALPALDEGQRDRLINLTASMDPGPAFGAAVSDLTAALPALNAQQRARLVSLAVDRFDSSKKSTMIAALARKLDDLTEPQRSVLIEAAAGIMEPHTRGNAIAALATAASSLNPTQRERLLTVAISSEPGALQRISMAEMGKALHALSEGQHRRLVNQTMALGNDDNKLRIIAGLACGLPHLAWGLQNQLIDFAAGAIESIGKAAALGDLAAQHACLSPDQKSKLLDAALNMEDHRASRVLSKFLQANAPLEEPHLQKVLETAVSAAAGQNGPSVLFRTAVEVLAANLAGLGVDQREGLIDTVLGIEDDNQKREAVEALAAGHENLSADELKRLVDTALSFADPEIKACAISSLWNGVHQLDTQTRSRLIDTVEHTYRDGGRPLFLKSLMPGPASVRLSTDERSRLLEAAASLPGNQYNAEGLTILARGLQHLDPPRRARLFDAIGRLDNPMHSTRALCAAADADEAMQATLR